MRVKNTNKQSEWNHALITVTLLSALLHAGVWHYRDLLGHRPDTLPPPKPPIEVTLTPMAESPRPLPTIAPPAPIPAAKPPGPAPAPTPAKSKTAPVTKPAPTPTDQPATPKSEAKSKPTPPAVVRPRPEPDLKRPLEKPVEPPAPKKEKPLPSPRVHQPSLREIEEDPNLPPIKPVERTLEKPPEPSPPRPAPKPRPSPKASPRPLDEEAPNLPPARSATPSPAPRSAPVRAATRPADPGPAQTSSDTPQSPARPSPSTASRSGTDAGGGAYEGAKANAAYLHNPKPEYPALAKRRQWEGKVILKVRVLADGKASQVSIATSSGHDVLDEAALEAVSQWHFVPAKRGGQAVESWVNVPINFNLLDAQ